MSEGNLFRLETQFSFPRTRKGTQFRDIDYLVVPRIGDTIVHDLRIDDDDVSDEWRVVHVLHENGDVTVQVIPVSEDY